MINSIRKAPFQIVLVSMLCCLVFALSGCTSAPSAGGNSSSEVSQDAGSAAAGDETVSDVVEIKTNYGTLSYPIGFEEIVTFEESDNDGVQSYEFSAVLNDEQIKVYTISFSQDVREDLGELLGTIDGDDGETVNVYFAPVEDIVNDKMSEDDQNTVYAAQETVNDVIASLHENKSFKESD